MAKSKLQVMAEEAAKFHPSVIVDIGYAQDPNTGLMNIGAKEVIGVDILNEPSPYTQNKVCDLNTQKLPFESESVDVVCMGCTLAHVSNPLKVLGEVNRILKKDGILILSSPNPHYYWENVLNVFFNYFSKRVSKCKIEEHFYDFSRYNIRSCALVTGFSLQKEIGITFHIIKTKINFNPPAAWPGLGYEIVYVLQKTGVPQSYGKAKTTTGLKTFQTHFYGEQ